MLETIDLSAHLDEGAFNRQKEAIQNELRRAQLKAWQNKLGVLIVLEGWSYSGRSAVARFLAQPMDPRGLKVNMMFPPTPEEARYPFHRRYWSLLPARPGHAATRSRRRRHESPSRPHCGIPRRRPPG